METKVENVQTWKHKKNISKLSIAKIFITTYYFYHFYNKKDFWKLQNFFNQKNNFLVTLNKNIFLSQKIKKIKKMEKKDIECLNKTYCRK